MMLSLHEGISPSVCPGSLLGVENHCQTFVGRRFQPIFELDHVAALGVADPFMRIFLAHGPAAPRTEKLHELLFFARGKKDLGLWGSFLLLFLIRAFHMLFRKLHQGIEYSWTF